MMLTGPDIYV